MIYHVEPILKAFIWGGNKIIDRYHLKTELSNVGEMYHVIALENHLDNIITETSEPLSVFYKNHPELFNCKCQMFPLRFATSCNENNQSYQLHPNNEYALKHEGTLGKVSGGINIEEVSQPSIKLMGHKCKNLEEFKKKVEKKDWENLFNKVTVYPGEFLNTPAGVIHGGKGSGTINVVFGTNSDITYRFYDFDRNDSQRPLDLQKVYDCLKFPDVSVKPVKIKYENINGCVIQKYYEEKKEYVAKRIDVDKEGIYEQKEFMFIMCSDGSGTIDGVSINPGETLFVPANYGQVIIKGKVRLYLISYIE